ncbi:hypothetical protein PG911_01155 [Tenacibaculum ovolyticum]|uniref:toxin-antitoxin system YwqK family antitoxin n=1 Tax=Tenacibaculum ovolyticum TaxID=104270 RepID=UPI0022F3F506|nr:hypothetical protein [Tenacibaculum ovolyticum]WBX76897.1 hypothetical protein PG911_01155 [Tenacibaculum ovolyticum]
MKSSIFLFLFFISFAVFSQKKYQKEYYNNNNLKTEGWLNNDLKINYWKFYYKNGQLKKEGNYKKNLSTKYWYFYRKNGTIEKEGHFVDGKKTNGGCFITIKDMYTISAS